VGNTFTVKQISGAYLVSVIRDKTRPQNKTKNNQQQIVVNDEMAKKNM